EDVSSALNDRVRIGHTTSNVLHSTIATVLGHVRSQVTSFLDQLRQFTFWNHATMLSLQSCVVLCEERHSSSALHTFNDCLVRTPRVLCCLTKRIDARLDRIIIIHDLSVFL